MAVYRIEIYTKLDAMYKVNLLKNNLARVFSCLFFLLTIQDEPQNVQHQKIIIYIQTHTIKKMRMERASHSEYTTVRIEYYHLFLIFLHHREQIFCTIVENMLMFLLAVWHALWFKKISFFGLMCDDVQSCLFCLNRK